MGLFHYYKDRSIIFPDQADLALNKDFYSF